MDEKYIGWSRIRLLGYADGLFHTTPIVQAVISILLLKIKKYLLYDNKICTGDEAAECIRCMSMRVAGTGYRVVESRGDHIRYTAQA